jgi:kynurenine formamidase
VTAPCGLPSYDDLPIRPGLPPHSSWGLWGDDDRRGCLNLLTPERALAGIAAVRDGVPFSLNLDLATPSPPLFGRSTLRHEVLWIDDGLGHDDELAGFNTQGSTQWDGFRHVRHPQHGFYNGLPDDEHGVNFWGALVGRAVVCDVARWRTADGRPVDCATNDVITADDIVATLAAQRTTVEPGDVLLLHTGWLDWYRQQPEPVRVGLAEECFAPGLAPGTDTVRLLWDLHVAAVAADNPGLEIEPAGSNLSPIEREASFQDDHHHERSAHFSLLPLLGLPIGELFDLGALAAACAADERWTCLFTSAPLALDRGVASPPSAIAIR